MIRWIPMLLALGCVPRTAARTDQPVLAAQSTTVDLYWPDADGPVPLVVVVHGFARSRHRMRGWGTFLADHGYAVAIPTLPTLARHGDNAAAVEALVAHVRATHPDRVLPDEAALMGFSAGGLATVLASPTVPDLDLWIGLDPVDSGGDGAHRARIVGVPGVAIQAEPHPCNARGNSEDLLADWSGPNLAVRVRGATHCDPEWPSDVGCALVCGEPTIGPQQAYEDVVLDLLEATFRCDPAAIEKIALLGSDNRLSGRIDDRFVAWLDGHCR